jgi:predicted nucleic-acid-binding protein
VRITADTNLLVRAVLDDDREQTVVALTTLSTAERVAVTLPTLCEFVWVLSRAGKRKPHAIAAAIRQLSDNASVQMDRPAVAAGLALLDAGGDFADGVIAFEGRRLGGDVFVSFDVTAVKRLKAAGCQAQFLST